MQDKLFSLFFSELTTPTIDPKSTTMEPKTTVTQPPQSMATHTVNLLLTCAIQSKSSLVVLLSVILHQLIKPGLCGQFNSVLLTYIKFTVLRSCRIGIRTNYSLVKQAN